MATVIETTKLSSLARMLIKENQLSKEDATRLQSQADAAKIPFITQIV